MVGLFFNSSYWCISILAVSLSDLLPRRSAVALLSCCCVFSLWASSSKLTAVLPHVKGLSQQLRRSLQQQSVRAVFKSETTLRSQLVRQKDAVDPAKQEGVVYRIPCECGKV